MEMGLGNFISSPLTEVAAACWEHCHPKEEGSFVNDKILVALCQIPFLTNASKVPCRQVGVNSSSSWQSTLPTPGFDNIKEKNPLPSPETKQSPFIFPALRTKTDLLPTSCFDSAGHCVPLVRLQRCFLYFNHRVHVRVKQIESRQLPCSLQSVDLWWATSKSRWFALRGELSRSELPRAEAKSKSTAIQTNTKAGTGEFGGGGGC